MIVSAQRFDVQALKRSRPLADVVTGDGIALRQLGQALVGPCPFHSDGEHPNFHVYSEADPASDHFHCYACGAHGDAIDFLMRRHPELSFPEACARLAEPVPTGRAKSANRTSVQQPRRWDRLGLAEQIVMNAAAALYQHQLWRTPSALEYLRGRGLTDDLIASCGIGYADGHALARFLRQRSWLRVGVNLGLLSRRADDDGTRPLRELLAGRVVVPEVRGGHAIWFIGRRLPSAEGESEERAKYLGLPGERPMLGQERVLNQREAFWVEGVFGWLTAVGWGLPACSPCGTHVPAERLGFLARARTVWGLLDPDEAGRSGADRLAAQLGTRWRPLWLPEGLEIDDLATRPDGRGVFFRLLMAARDDLRQTQGERH